MINPHHIIIDLYDCLPNVLSSKILIAEWMNNSIEMTNMTAVGKPIIEQFAGENPLDNGITAAQTLAESLISIHTYPREKAVYIDIFSCRPFNTDNLYKYSQVYFNGRGYCQSIPRLSFDKEITKQFQPTPT